MPARIANLFNTRTSLICRKRHGTQRLPSFNVPKLDQIFSFFKVDLFAALKPGPGRVNPPSSTFINCFLRFNYYLQRHWRTNKNSVHRATLGYGLGNKGVTGSIASTTVKIAQPKSFISNGSNRSTMPIENVKAFRHYPAA